MLSSAVLWGKCQNDAWSPVLEIGPNDFPYFPYMASHPIIHAIEAKKSTSDQRFMAVVDPELLRATASRKQQTEVSRTEGPTDSLNFTLTLIGKACLDKAVHAILISCLTSNNRRTGR